MVYVISYPLGYVRVFSSAKRAAARFLSSSGGNYYEHTGEDAIKLVAARLRRGLQTQGDSDCGEGTLVVSPEEVE